jgi:hypothetical protein
MYPQSQLSPMSEQFISEPIEPLPGTASATAMTRGEPGLPGMFVWRGEEYRVAEVLDVWKQADARDCDEKYTRKHWYRVRTVGGEVMTLYFLRQPSTSRRPKARWFLYSIEENLSDH